MHLGPVGGRAHLQDLGFGALGLLSSDKAVLQHAFDDVLLADARAARVFDRVVGRRRLGQASQHRRLGNGDVLERFAKVGFAGSGKAVGPVAQEDLVHIDFQNLVFGQVVLELEGQQYLVNLARKGLLGGQIHIARHLHGDGRGALALGAAHVGRRRPHHAQVIDATVLEKAGVFDRQNSVFHHRRNLFDGRERAVLFAKFPDQLTFGRKNAQRQLGVVVLQIGNIRQIGVGHGHDDGHQDDTGGQPGSKQPEKNDHDPSHPAPHRACGGGFWGLGLGRGGRRLGHTSNGRKVQLSPQQAGPRRSCPRTLPRQTPMPPLPWPIRRTL